MKPFAAAGRLSASLLLVSSLGLVLRLAWPALAQREIEAPADLKPIPSGPGIQICEPVATGNDALADFGGGCGLWLQWSMGFHPQLGQTPRWESVSQARSELKSSRLRLSLAQGAKLYNIEGVTHIAVGQITGTPEKCLLTYQLYAVPTQKAVGAPIKLTGTEEQVIAQLPGAARTILTALGVQKLQVPASVGATSAELTAVGHYPWYQDQKPTDAEQQEIDALGKKLPLATLLSYVHHPVRPVKERETADRQLLEQASGNFLMLGAIATLDGHPAAEIAHTMDTQVAALEAPNNALLVFWAVDKMRTTDELVKGFEQMVRLAPHSANAWYILGLEYEEQAQAIRLGRVYAGLSPQESEKLTGIYARGLYAATQATKLDPDYEDAWRELTKAATFAGAFDRADAAFWKAMSLNKSDTQLYYWGLEMYQEKWGGNPAALAKVARLAAAAVFPVPSDLYGLGTELQSAGFPAEAKMMFARAIVQQRELVRLHPKSGNIHAYLGSYLSAQGQTEEAETELKTAIQLDPNSAYARASLGRLYQAQNRFAEAVAQYREVVRITNSIDSKMELAGALIYAQVYAGMDPKYAEAQKLFNEVLKIQPNNSNANQEMGWILSRNGEYDAALTFYSTAASLTPEFEVSRREMGRIYRLQSKFDDAIREGKMAVAISPKSYYALAELAETYGAKGDNEEAVKLYRKAIDAAPSAAQGYLDFGSFLIKIGKKDEGRAQIKHVLEMNVAANMKKAAQDLLDKNP